MYEPLCREFLRVADQCDAVRFGQVLSPDVVWTFGNFPTLRGRAPVVESLTGFFQLVPKMNHRIVGYWETAECAIVETRVRYGDCHGRSFEYPACEVMWFRDGLCSEARIFVDNHELFTPAAL